MQLIDTHCHLTHAKCADDEADVVERARAAGLVACITIATGIEDAAAAFDVAARHPDFVHVSTGLDPFSCHRLGDGFDAAFERLRTIVAEHRPVAIGEIGLDFHYDLDPYERQAECLERQLALARDTDLPVVIHVRDAHPQMIEVLGRNPDNRGVIHSFTGGPAEARAYLDLGWHLAFNGVLTFKNAPEVRDAARLAPEERLLIETDSPYLAPVPHRGRRCEPAYVRDTAACLAAERGIGLAACAELTTVNARALFGL